MRRKEEKYKECIKQKEQDKKWGIEVGIKDNREDEEEE